MAVWRCLGGRLLVIEQELVDDRLEGPQDGSGSLPLAGNGIGLRMLQDLPDRVSRVFKFEGDSLDGHPIPMSPPNGTAIVHRKHSLDLRASELLRAGVLTVTKALTGGHS